MHWERVGSKLAAWERVTVYTLLLGGGSIRRGRKALQGSEREDARGTAQLLRQVGTDSCVVVRRMTTCCEEEHP